MEQVLLPPALKALLPQQMHGACAGGRFKKNEKLFLAGTSPEWMFFVVAGEVTLERTGLQGESVVLQRTRQGFVSEASLKTAKYHCDASAIADTTVIKLPIKDLAAALDADPLFASRWITMLDTEVKRLRLQCERLSMKSVKDRVLHLLHTDGKNGQYPVSSGYKTLAAELGVTHEALYRTLASLEKAQVIQRQDGILSLWREDVATGRLLTS